MLIDVISRNLFLRGFIMTKTNFNQILSIIISCAMLMVVIIPQGAMKVYAISCRKDGFDKSRYTLTGNMAEDVATIAKSQKERTGAQFGYTEAWCDEFVADCIENAGADSSIVGHGGTVADFESVMRKKGAEPVSSPQTGDLVFFTWSHVEIVTKVENGVPYCAGGNNGSTGSYKTNYCKGERKVSDVGSTRPYLRPAYTNANPHPIGCLDSYGTDGRNVSVSGWTYDPSSPSSQLAVHIYLRDSGGGMHCIGALTADQSRPDVNAVYGCGDYHGYDGSGSAVGLAAGEYTVQVAYLDVEDGGNGATWVSGGTVTINPDSEGPSISDIKIIDISKDGYTVQCTAEDSSGVSSVRFPTWTDNNGQDDIIWGEGSVSGNIWTYRVNISDHNNERGAYTTHIYAYDNAGNQNAVGTSAYLEDIAPQISNVTVSDISASGYTVRCTVTDEGGSGLDHVQFPTWTTENDQDDIQPSWPTNQTASGTIDGDTVTYRVNISDHNNETGCYRTHIYAYDKSGNASCVAVDDVILENTPPMISNVKIADIDDTGYTVQCTVTDEGTGVDHVAFPTWTISRNGQDDLDSGWENSEKYAGIVESDGSTYTYRVNISDHNNEKGCYRTHIYAWDKSGNMAYCTSSEQLNHVMIDDSNPVIFNIRITNIDMTGYTISCDIRNDINIDRVQFPTWTDLNVQDDIQADWTVSEKASGTPIGNTYVYRVRASEHNNELGPYITHIYAYNCDGNYYHVSTAMNVAGLSQVILNETVEIPSGDVNDDGIFSVSDVVLHPKWLLAVPDTHLANWQAADFCSDGKLDVFDLCLMKRMLIYG